MAAIVDKDNTLDISKVSEGLQKALPSYARPLFIRKLNAVELTGRIEVVTDVYKKYSKIILNCSRYIQIEKT